MCLEVLFQVELNHSEVLEMLENLFVFRKNYSFCIRQCKLLNFQVLYSFIKYLHSFKA